MGRVGCNGDPLQVFTGAKEKNNNCPRDVSQLCTPALRRLLLQQKRNQSIPEVTNRNTLARCKNLPFNKDGLVATLQHIDKRLQRKN